jgi:osmotically-inducible protein OsmY
MVQVFGWVAGGLIVCIGLVFGSQQAVLWLPPWPSEWTLPNLENPIEPPPAQSSEPPVTPPRPEFGPALSTRELADAINGELRRADFEWAIVRVAEDGIATVSGSAPSTNTHDELLLWLQSVSGVERIVDETKIHLPSASHAQQKPRPRTETLPVADTTSIVRVVQRELALLGLDNVTVEVAMSGEVTLRGRADDAAIKTKAIAAARTATPGGRVRDLIFVVEK